MKKKKKKTSKGLKGGEGKFTLPLNATAGGRHGPPKGFLQINKARATYHMTTSIHHAAKKEQDTQPSKQRHHPNPPTSTRRVTPPPSKTAPSPAPVITTVVALPTTMGSTNDTSPTHDTRNSPSEQLARCTSVASPVGFRTSSWAETGEHAGGTADARRGAHARPKRSASAT